MALGPTIAGLSVRNPLPRGHLHGLLPLLFQVFDTNVTFSEELCPNTLVKSSADP